MPLPRTGDQFIEAHQGIHIMHADGSGFYAANGCDDFGYCDTLDEIRAEIDDYWHGAEHGPLNGIFD